MVYSSVVPKTHHSYPRFTFKFLTRNSSRKACSHRHPVSVEPNSEATEKGAHDILLPTRCILMNIASNPKRVNQKSL